MHYPVYTAWWRWTSTAASVPYRSRSATRTRECTVPRVWPPCTCTSPCTRNQRRLPTMQLWCRFGRSISPQQLGLQTGATLSGCLRSSRRPKTLRCRFERSSPPFTRVTDRRDLSGFLRSSRRPKPEAPPLDQGREFVQSIAPPIGLQAGVTIFCPGSSVRLSASQGLEVPRVRL